MAARKVCKHCNRIYEGEKCPDCGSQEYGEEIKGKVIIIDAENSEIAKKLNLKKKGEYAIKSK